MLRRDFGGQEVDCFSDQKQQLDRRYSPLSSNRRMPHLTRKYWMHLVSLMNSYPISRPPVECCNIQQEESTLPLCGLVERQLPSIGRTGREPDAGFDPRGSRALDVQAHMCYSPPMTPTTPPTGSFPHTHRHPRRAPPSQYRCGTVAVLPHLRCKGVGNPLHGSEPPAMRSHKMQQFSSFSTKTTGLGRVDETLMRQAGGELVGPDAWNGTVTLCSQRAWPAVC